MRRRTGRPATPGGPDWRLFVPGLAACFACPAWILAIGRFDPWPLALGVLGVALIVLSDP